MTQPSRRAPQVLINPPGNELGGSNAILTGCTPKYVDAFAGALSIKWMAAGWALWETPAGQYRVDPSCYLVLNHGQVYSLTRDAAEPQESFCPFFATGFVEDVQRALVTPDAELLDEPDATLTTEFFEQLYPADKLVTPQLQRMRQAVRTGNGTDTWLEGQFHVLAERLLRTQAAVRRDMGRIPAVRPATRAELFRRLHRARDYMHAHFAEPLPLATVARVACLSTHHFHRLFRQAFREPPHRYVLALRMARAKTLLAHTDLSVTEICFEAGFESLGAFSTRFRREVGASPQQFRAAHGRNSQDRRSVA